MLVGGGFLVEISEGTAESGQEGLGWPCLRAGLHALGGRRCGLIQSGRTVADLHLWLQWSVDRQEALPMVRGSAQEQWWRGWRGGEGTGPKSTDLVIVYGVCVHACVLVYVRACTRV